MIILNKRKDYYDHLTKVYGVDSKKVLDRKDDVTSDELHFTEPYIHRPWLSAESNTHAIYIANRKYLVEQTSKGVWELHFFHKTNINYAGRKMHKLSSELPNNHDWDSYVESDFNKKHGRVLSIEVSSFNYQSSGTVFKSPILSSFGFGVILTPNEIYSEIDMLLGWFIDNPCKVGELDDKGKLLANGFDDKVSFRHRK